MRFKTEIIVRISSLGHGDIAQRTRVTILRRTSAVAECLDSSSDSARAPIPFRTRSNDPISRYEEPVKRTNEIKGYTASLVLCTGFS